MKTTLVPFTTAPARAALLLALAGVLGAASAAAQEAGAETFATPQQAVDALAAATKANDVTALNRILGPSAASLISSGDDGQDKKDRAQFDALYEAHHRLVYASGRLTLVVGKNEWPLPIPVIMNNGQWSFDSEAGARELVYRRIGQNELAAIEIGRTLYRAQLEYAATAHDGNEKGLYARRFKSSPGTHDGLYWPAADGEPQSPAGPLVASAEVEGDEPAKRQPFHGYYFRVLKAQGPHAPGGEKVYLVDGKMRGGFAILAYPVEYGASGVMSFLVSSSGTVFEKDLGDSTTEVARAMRAFDPDPSWNSLQATK